MVSGCDKKRKSVGDDRLSSLPDDLIHKILKFVDIKHVIEIISVLSSRWRFIWTSMPYLEFSSENFDRSYNFYDFVTTVLSRRNNQRQLSSLKLILHVKVSATFAERVLYYAFSHNVETVSITCFPKGCVGVPLYVLSSPSLRHLTLSGASYNYPLMVMSNWEFPALTTLYLECMALYDLRSEKCVSLFSECTNLKNLTLNHFNVVGSGGFSICLPRLSNLTLQNGDWGFKVVRVVAPQLKRLTIVECTGKHLLSTPRLASLLFKGYSPSSHFFADGFPSLEKVHLCIYNPDKMGAPKIIGVLQQFHNVKYLALTMNIIQLLASSRDLISNQPSPFAKLRNLKIFPASVCRCSRHKKFILPIEVNNYLLGSSPGATCNGLPQGHFTS